jgi:hypothetical protein
MLKQLLLHNGAQPQVERLLYGISLACDGSNVLKLGWQVATAVCQHVTETLKADEQLSVCPPVASTGG